MVFTHLTDTSWSWYIVWKIQLCGPFSIIYMHFCFCIPSLGIILLNNAYEGVCMNSCVNRRGGVQFLDPPPSYTPACGLNPSYHWLLVNGVLLGGGGGRGHHRFYQSSERALVPTHMSSSHLVTIKVATEPTTPGQLITGSSINYRRPRSKIRSYSDTIDTGYCRLQD